MLRDHIPAPVVRKLLELLFPIPRRLSQRHIPIDAAGLDRIRESIRANYHQGWRREDRYSEEMYQADLEAHLHRRLEIDRRMVVPWLDDARSLDGMRVLEIGCGTGSSTVALAEQGAEVTGIDIDRDALAVAKDRCEVYGVRAEFHALNVQELSAAFAARVFDSVIFFASLEHMTIPERLAGLRDAWQMLPLGGLLVVVETPNRLWFDDRHTSWLPFFNWLPDELAFRYSSFSPRQNFKELYREYHADAAEHFLRRGRGMSFHEFDLAIKPATELKVVSSLSSFAGLRYSVQRSILERRFKSLLRSICPDIHEGFCDDHLFLIIERD